MLTIVEVIEKIEYVEVRVPVKPAVQETETEPEPTAEELAKRKPRKN